MSVTAGTEMGSRAAHMAGRSLARSRVSLCPPDHQAIAELRLKEMRNTALQPRAEDRRQCQEGSHLARQTFLPHLEPFPHTKLSPFWLVQQAPPGAAQRVPQH